MKNYILYFSIFFVSQMSFAQTTYNTGDLNGQWIATKLGAELTLEIQGSQASIISLGKTSLTTSLLGGNMYESINYEGNGIWKAQRNSWIYNGVGGNNSDSGHWEKGPNLTLTLSKDKNTLSASGHWSYKRVNRVVEDSDNETRSVLYEDFEGVTGNTVNSGNSNDNKSKVCPTYGFKFSNNNPSYNCVALEWWSLSTKTNMVDASGNFKQSTDPQARSFTIEFRKQGDVYWTTEKRANSGKNTHTISGLDACTKYEVRLFTMCDNNQVSAPTNIIRFTTACTKPGNLSVENITNNSAKVSSERLTALFTSPCSSSSNTQIRIIELKTNTGTWQEVICNSGSPCVLSALSPGTIYRVRARYKYGNKLYSNYTNEISFTTSVN